MNRFAWILILLTSTSACAPMANGEMAYLFKEIGANVPWKDDKAEFQEHYPEAARSIVDELDMQLAGRLAFDQTSARNLQWVVVTTPTDLNNMGQATALSRVMAEELGSAMTSKGYYVQEVRKTSELIFDKAQGEFMLSRDVKTLSTRRFQSTLVVAGTYVASPSGVRFNVEVIDARNNDVLAKTSRVIPMNSTVAYLMEAQAAPGSSNIRPTTYTVPGAKAPGISYQRQGDWRTSTQKLPNFLLP